jgi:FKBP-type peptidyl-prolyl cis-trans isomerase 2
MFFRHESPVSGPLFSPLGGVVDLSGVGVGDVADALGADRVFARLLEVVGEDETGEVILYAVTEIADGKVIVDGNHPWAGERVVFTATIKDVRAANKEEVSHQHVHGAGGHHH